MEVCMEPHLGPFDPRSRNTGRRQRFKKSLNASSLVQNVDPSLTSNLGEPLLVDVVRVSGSKPSCRIRGCRLGSDEISFAA